MTMSDVGSRPKATYQPRRRVLPRAMLALVLLALAALAWFWRPISAQGLAGAAYGARVGCSCRFIGGRGLSDCRKDLEPGMGLVTLSEDAEAKSVTARNALMFAQTATFRPGEGCVLEKWDD